MTGKRLGRNEALALVRELGAPPRLVRHVELVGEAGDAILKAVAALDVRVDVARVEAGIVFHDVGKIRHPSELDEPGHAHEETGQRMLLEEGVSPELARSCVSHARWADEGVTLEERLVALADKLWKGKRETALEELVVEAVARRSGGDRWSVFTSLDEAFEKIAAGADDRLARSR